MTITSISARVEKEFYIELEYVDDYESESNDRIDETAEEHISKMISDGYTEGELHTTDPNDPEVSHRGWWKIIDGED
jgi:hypothetical protein